MSCPADQEITALLDGSLAPGAIALLEAHLASCDDCALLVGHLGALGEPTPEIIGGRYRVESLLGRGGMGEVWAAFDPELERRVAIKLIRADLGDSGSKRLVREARALARLHDPNVVAVYDVGESDGEMFVVTELVDGETLETWQRDRERSELLDAYLQAASGLAAAHREGLVHRDIKPTNIFVGNDGRAVVGDFGLAISAGAPGARGEPSTGSGDSRATAAGHVAGTPAYMAPEQSAGGEADARSDQFALAMSLVEALNGKRVEAGVSETDLERCGSLAPVLCRALASAPGDRYPDMTSWADAVAAATTTSRRSRGPIALAVATIAVALAGTIAITTLGGGDAQRRATSAPVQSDAGPTVATTAVDAAADARPIAAPDAAAVIATARRRASPPPAPPATTTNAPAPAGIDDADRALRRGDTAACLTAIGSIGAVSGRERERVVTTRARCEMLAGDCAAGSNRLRALGADDRHVAAEASAHCPTDRGDIATRVGRLYTQVSMFAMHRRFGCRRYEKPTRAAMAHADLGTVPGGTAKLASVINNLVECHAKAGRCERASALLTAGRAQRLPVMTAISGCSP